MPPSRSPSPTPPPVPDEASLRRAFREHGQEQVFSSWDGLDAPGRASLLADLSLVDFGWLARRRRQLEEAGPSGPSGAASADDSAAVAGQAPSVRPEPPPVIRIPRGEAESALRRQALEAGEEALRAGRVAAFLVAGGQGTRLGFDGPKGMYPAGPVTGRTLFHWHADQIRARQARYGAAIPWYIMTSRANDAATRAFFREHGFLGLREEDVFFFSQEMVPALDFTGRLLLAGPAELSLSPNGHGGALSGLARSGALEDMRRRGVDAISYFQVDNPLVGIADPVFAGRHLLAGSEMSSRVVAKSHALEKVGNLVSREGRLEVIEYSDFDPALAQATEADGRLRYWAGSVAIHMLSTDFVGRVGGGGEGLPWHVARKRIPHWQGGRPVRPDRENGVKFETFVFDALPLARRTMTEEVAREDEFGPIKNAEGPDSPATSRQLLSNRAARWLRAAGARVPGEPGGDVPVPLEVSPAYALDAAELARKVPPGLLVTGGLALL